MALATTQGAIRAAESMLGMIEKDAPIAQLVAEGDPVAMQLNEGQRRNILRSQDIVKLWRGRGRQTLAMHPGMVDELKVASSDRIPTDVLRALPYINPMVVYADPPSFPSWEKLTGERASTPESRGIGDTMRLMGFFTHSHAYAYDEGRRTDGFFSDTDDPESGMFAVFAIFEVLDASGEVIDWEANTLSVPFGVVNTVKELVDDLSRRFYFDSNAVAAAMPDGAQQWLRKVMSTMLGTLFYLCSTTLEAEKVPASATRQFRNTIARRPLSLYRVGWTTGAALTRMREGRERKAPSEQGDITHQQDPQHRRTHIKVVWTGKGRTIPKIALVTAYWTHPEKMGETGINTVHMVPPDKQSPIKESIRTATGLRP